MCMIDFSGGDFSRAESRIARKTHRCGDCGRAIEPGEQYTSATGHSEGVFWTSKLCAHCHAAAGLLTRYCGGYVYEGIHDDLEEHISEGLPWSRDAARMVVGIRRRWKRLRGDGLIDLSTIHRVVDRSAGAP